MKIDLKIEFSKTFCTSYSIVNGKSCVKSEYIFPYVANIVDNILGEERYDVNSHYESIVDAIFRLILNEANEKYFVGWYCIDKNMREFLVPTKIEEIYECIFHFMKNYIYHEGTLTLYFELV